MCVRIVLISLLLWVWIGVVYSFSMLSLGKLSVMVFCWVLLINSVFLVVESVLISGRWFGSLCVRIVFIVGLVGIFLVVVWVW